MGTAEGGLACDNKEAGRQRLAGSETRPSFATDARAAPICTTYVFPFVLPILISGARKVRAVATYASNVDLVGC